MRTPNIQSVACPGSALGQIHYCPFDVKTGIWKCYECGLGGTAQGYAHLNNLEAERHRLTTELDILKFEVELSERRGAA